MAQDDDRTAPLPGGGGEFGGAELSLPARIDAYVLTRQIGRGAMGRVFLADQLEPVRRQVAVKLLSTELVDAEVVARFEAERQALALMNHPNIARVFDAGATSAGQPYFVMEYAPGDTLVRYCDTHRLSLRRRLDLFGQVTAAVRHAHQKGVIHRDLKPSNILVTEQDGVAVPKVIDFGLAKAVAGQLADRSLRTHAGTLLGTPAYMSPEQASLSAEAIDTRSDIYALGLVLFELLTGTLPFGRMGESRTTIEHMLRSIREDDPPRPSALFAATDPAERPRGLDRSVVSQLREDLDWIVIKCLAKRPDDRYASAADLAADLERFLRNEPVLARRSSFGYVMGKQLRRHRVPLAVGAGVVLLALVLGGGWLQSRMAAEARAEAAQRFGQSVQRLDGMLRLAHSIPLHDTTGTRERLERQLRDLEMELPGLGAWARGPALYAMGRVSLSLGRTESALEHLEAAWEREYRPPEVAHALGLANGRMYQAGLEALEGETNADRRRAREQELKSRYRDPAVRYLKLGDGGQGEPAAYGEALISYYEADHERARDLAGKAAASAPWLYEAELLVGDAWRAEGNRHRDGGDYDAALAAYGRAGEAYSRAAAVGESDPAVYVRACALASERMQLHLYGPAAETSGIFSRGNAACDDALVAHPASADAHARRARLLLMHGRLTEKGEGDPVPLYKRAAEAGRRAAELDPDLEAGPAAAGAAYQKLAEFAADQSGADPQEWLARAGDVYRRALEANPDNPDLYNELGNIHAIRGEYLQFYTNDDPLPDFRRAEDYYVEAIGRRPDSPYYLNNQGILYADIASELRVNDGDPAPWFDRAFDTYRRAIELKPDHTFAYNNLGIAYVNRARHAREVGEDPMPWLSDAVEALEQSVALRADYRNGWHNLGRAHLNRLETISDRGGDPGPEAEAALAAFRRALENRATADTWLNIGNTHLSLARHAVDFGQDPEAELEAADQAYSKALDIVPHHTHALGNRWDVSVVRGYYRLNNGGDALAPADTAIEGLTGLAERFPENYEPREKLADAWLLRARHLMQAGEDPSESLDQAVKHLEHALRINPDASGERLERVEIELLRAAWRLDRDGAADPFLATAESMLDEAAAGNGEAQRARLALLRARADVRASRDPIPALQRAATAADRFHRQLPDHPRSLALQARVACWNSRLTGTTPSSETMEKVDRLVSEWPDRAEAWALNACLMTASNRDAAAEQARQRAERINPRIGPAAPAP